MFGWPRRTLLFVFGIALVIVLSLGYWQRAERHSSFGSILKLAPPTLVRSAEAAGDQVLSDLSDEAGISAYYQAPSSINLELVRDSFDTLEIETETYIVGSVDISGYDDGFDAHVYVDVDGWILAYYFKDDPVSKIADPLSRSLNNMLLKEAVGTIASAAGQPFSEVDYYDFRYPNATNIMFVGEHEGGANDSSFTIEIPSSYGYFERSWASSDGRYFQLNGVGLLDSTAYDGNSDYGSISAGDFATDTTHTVTQSRFFDNQPFGILVIVYVVPA